MSHQSDIKECRTFGLLVGGIFTLIGWWPVLFRSESPRMWAISIGGALVGLGLIFPASLIHVHRLWMKLGHVLGFINTRILLGVVFFALITPMGLAMRIFGKDTMGRRFDLEADTYRVVRTPRARMHMKNQF